jgi:hypothetical protein
MEFTSEAQSNSTYPSLTVSYFLLLIHQMLLNFFFLDALGRNFLRLIGPRLLTSMGLLLKDSLEPAFTLLFGYMS